MSKPGVLLLQMAWQSASEEDIVVHLTATFIRVYPYVDTSFQKIYNFLFLLPVHISAQGHVGTRQTWTTTCSIYIRFVAFVLILGDFF